MVSSNFNSDLFKYLSLKKSIEVHLNKPEIFLLYFTTHMTSIRERTEIGRSMAYLCRTSVFIEFHYFMKKKTDTAIG